MPSRRILIADDEHEMLEVVATVLEETGAEVVRATTGGTLLELLAEDSPYDLLITDIAMPWVNGLQVAHAMRSSGLRMPILLMTARATPEIEREIKTLGDGAVLLRKPFALVDLEAAIASLIPPSPFEPERPLAAAGVSP